MRACVIFNPAARGEKARRFRDQIGAWRTECTFFPTAAPGDAQGLAARCLKEGYDTIVGAGGDGTLNEILNGIADVPDGLSRARLGVLPLGTANVFARELGLPRDVASAWEVIRGGREVTLDLPWTELRSGEATRRRFFLQLAGAGWDARAVALASWELKKRISYLAYIVAGVQALCERQVPIEAAGDATTRTGEQILVGNGRYYGGRFRLFPQADPRDGLLDVCVFPRVTWRTPIACFWGMLTNRLSRLPGVHHFQTRSLRLAAPARALVELDGELVGELPASFGLLPGALRVLAP